MFLHSNKMLSSKQVSKFCFIFQLVPKFQSAQEILEINLIFSAKIKTNSVKSFNRDDLLPRSVSALSTYKQFLSANPLHLHDRAEVEKKLGINSFPPRCFRGKSVFHAFKKQFCFDSGLVSLSRNFVL
jgi:hypothetical protein